MFPVSVCLGIEKRDASPKIEYSASLANSLLGRACQLMSLRFDHPAIKMTGYFQ
jgi:hypothetical protein